MKPSVGQSSFISVPAFEPRGEPNYEPNQGEPNYEPNQGEPNYLAQLAHVGQAHLGPRSEVRFRIRLILLLRLPLGLLLRTSLRFGLRRLRLGGLGGLLDVIILITVAFPLNRSTR